MSVFDTREFARADFKLSLDEPYFQALNTTEFEF